MFKNLSFLLLTLISIQASSTFLYAGNPNGSSNTSSDEANCSICKNLDDFLNQNQAESTRRKELLENLIGVLGELAQAQSAFTANGDFTDIFPAAYYHVTELEMQNILSNKYAYPAEKMEMMMSFYDAYRYNRARWDSGDTNNVEPQWLNYFTKARNFNSIMKNSSVFGPSDGIELMSVLDSGIQAHVGFDLPRAIRSTYQNKISSSANRQTLSSEFLDSNRLFIPAMQAANTDISLAISRSQTAYPKPAALNLAGKVAQAADSVIDMRENAFKLANSNERLPTSIRPQPTTNHQNLNQIGKTALEKMKKDCESCPFPVEISAKVVGGKPTGTVRGVIAGKPAMLWDVPPFDAPDIVICISEGNSAPKCTAECSDSYSCIFTTFTVSSKIFKVQVIDIDLFEHDLIGANTCRIDSPCTVGRAQITIKHVRK